MTDPQSKSASAARKPSGNRKPKRRFGGTAAQIRTSLAFYKVLAYTTGSMLLLLCLEMIFRYGFGLSLMAGGTNAATGAGFGIGMVSDPSAVIGGVNISITVLIVHGWMYVLYLISDFRLWSLMRWPFSKFVLIALGGVVPFLSFITEKKIHRQAQRELAEFPQATTRY